MNPQKYTVDQFHSEESGKTSFFILEGGQCVLGPYRNFEMAQRKCDRLNGRTK